MQKEMIVSTNGHETMVAILEDDEVAEVFVERERQRGVVGNVYKGRVSKVLPGMQSSFIDIGLARDGFLYVTDVVDTMEEFDKLESGDEDPSTGSGQGPGKEREGDGSTSSPSPRAESRGDKPAPKIEELLKDGQEI